MRQEEWAAEEEEGHGSSPFTTRWSSPPPLSATLLHQCFNKSRQAQYLSRTDSRTLLSTIIAPSLRPFFLSLSHSLSLTHYSHTHPSLSTAQAKAQSSIQTTWRRNSSSSESEILSTSSALLPPRDRTPSQVTAPGPPLTPPFHFLAPLSMLACIALSSVLQKVSRLWFSKCPFDGANCRTAREAEALA